MSDNEKYSNNYDSDDEEYYKQLNVERKNKYKERYSSSTPSKEYTPKKHTPIKKSTTPPKYSTPIKKYTTPIKSTPIKKNTTPPKYSTPIKKHTPIKSVNINKGAYNRLKEFLNIHNYILINSYSLNDNECIFIKVYDNINSNFIIITIPDTYNIISEGYNIKLEYIEDIHKIPTTNNNGYKSIKDENLIDENEYLDDEKTIAYPGSLIQQNFGEDLIHGILVWDTINNSSEFIEIKNDFGYVTFELNGTQLDAYYTALPTIVSQTLTVTGNWGTATDTPSIATAKGWTVTG
jgi:hypothetical protein